MVIGKEGNLSGVVDRSGLHVKVGPTDGSRIRDLDVPFIDLSRANDYAALGDATTHNGTESDLTRIIDIRHRANRDIRPVLEARSSQFQGKKMFHLQERDRQRQPLLLRPRCPT